MIAQFDHRQQMKLMALGWHIHNPEASKVIYGASHVIEALGGDRFRITRFDGTRESVLHEELNWTTLLLEIPKLTPIERAKARLLGRSQPEPW